LALRIDMSKKLILGIYAGMFALAMWACGDGAIDAPSDKDVMLVGRYSDEVDGHILDSMIAVCNGKSECKAAMELAFKNDKNIREITDSIIVDDNGDTSYIYSSGALPKISFAFETSSSSVKAEEDDEVSNPEESSSSRRRPTSSADDEPVYVVSSTSTSGDDEGTPEKQELSSTSKTVYSSVTISSSSAAKQSSSSYAKLSSSSKKATNSSSSGAVRSSTSKPSNCNVAVVGTCKPSKTEVQRFESVTWTFTPAADSRTGGEIVWNNFDDGEITQKNGLTFATSFSVVGDKKNTEFTMDVETCAQEKGSINVVSCDKVTVVPRTLSGCKCELVGDAIVDLVEVNGGVAKDFTWKVTGCSAFGTPKFAYAWNGSSGTSSTLKMNLVKPKTYTPSVTVSLMDGTSVETTDAPECPTLTIKNALLPTEIETVDSKVYVKSGDRLQIVGDALSSGSKLSCWRVNGTRQNAACGVEFVSGETTVPTTMGSCQSNDGWQNVTFALSNLDEDGIVTVTMTDVTAGTNELNCKVEK